MTKSKTFSLIILIGTFVFTAGFIDNCCEDDEEDQQRDAEFANVMLKQMENENANTANENTNADEEEPTNQAPEIQGINISQLHQNYPDTPHRYQLTAIVRDPEGDVVSYSWTVDCGYLIQEDPINVYTNRKEWRYDTPGECVEATITLKVYDSQNNMTPYTLKPF
ncbi:MAG: hypothetical protein ABIB97_05715 [Patescibacteria group bacterium]